MTGYAPMLIHAIRERPGDPGLRLAFAAWLTRRGDPRGEYITLACTRPDSPRIPALFARHGHVWIGELPALVDGTDWLARFESFRR
jgi:uncharacterized protein (TIGR02996 family)